MLFLNIYYFFSDWDGSCDPADALCWRAWRASKMFKAILKFLFSHILRSRIADIQALSDRRFSLFCLRAWISGDVFSWFFFIVRIGIAIVLIISICKIWRYESPEMLWILHKKRNALMVGQWEKCYNFAACMSLSFVAKVAYICMKRTNRRTKEKETLLATER